MSSASTGSCPGSNRPFPIIQEIISTPHISAYRIAFLWSAAWSNIVSVLLCLPYHLTKRATSSGDRFGGSGGIDCDIILPIRIFHHVGKLKSSLSIENLAFILTSESPIKLRWPFLTKWIARIRTSKTTHARSANRIYQMIYTRNKLLLRTII